MPEDFREGRRWKVRIGVGTTVCALLGGSILSAGSLVSPENLTAGFLGANPGNTLRVLQSVGILLPLFIGLLRFTASDDSGVSGQVNDHLLLGIFGLVLAGVFATIAGILTTVEGILKLSLLFVLFTFIVIGLAAGAMFGEVTTKAENDLTRRSDVVDEPDDEKPKHPTGDAPENNVIPLPHGKSDSESNDEAEQAKGAREE